MCWIFQHGFWPFHSPLSSAPTANPPPTHTLDSWLSNEVAHKRHLRSCEYLYPRCAFDLVHQAVKQQASHGPVCYWNTRWTLFSWWHATPQAFSCSRASFSIFFCLFCLFTWFVSCSQTISKSCACNIECQNMGNFQTAILKHYHFFNTYF